MQEALPQGRLQVRVVSPGGASAREEANAQIFQGEAPFREIGCDITSSSSVGVHHTAAVLVYTILCIHLRSCISIVRTCSDYILLIIYKLFISS